MTGQKGIICLLGLLLVSFVVSAQQLKIRDEKGKLFPMGYSTPRIFKPIPHSQIQTNPGDIGPVDLEMVSEVLNPIQSNILSVATTFFKRKDEQIIYQAEYVYYNTKYNLDKERAEIPICVISPFHNFFASESWQLYLDTLENQNYTNFHVVMTDDQSTDNSTIRILKLVEKKYPRLSRRITLLKTKDAIGMLGNHDIQIRNHCQDGQLVVEVDGDDSLIGRQVMKLLNAHYTDNPQMWFIYTQMLLKSGESYLKFGNKQIPQKIFNSNTYRTSGLWVTSHLKTYYRAVYMKIPPQYFWRAPGLYHYHAADFFNIMAIVQLSGGQHTHYLDEIVYLYKPSGGCSRRLGEISSKLAKMKTPFLPLKDLTDTAQITPNYQIPQAIKISYNIAISNGYSCVQKLRKQINDPTYMTKIKI